MTGNGRHLTPLFPPRPPIFPPSAVARAGPDDVGELDLLTWCNAPISSDGARSTRASFFASRRMSFVYKGGFPRAQHGFYTEDEVTVTAASNVSRRQGGIAEVLRWTIVGPIVNESIA